MEIDVDAKAAHLYEHGYVVMDVMAPSEVAAMHVALMRDVAASSEFVPGTD